MVDNSLGEADYYNLKDYATFGTRLLVIIIDSVVLFLCGVALWIPLATLFVSGVLETDPSGIFWLAYAALIWWYLGPLKRSDFGTLGFKLLGVKLVSAKGGRPSLGNMTVRMLMWTFGPFNFLLDLLWLGADTESQSLRDCYLGTYLVKRQATPVGRGPLHLTRYCAMGFALAYPRVCRPKESR